MKHPQFIKEDSFLRKTRFSKVHKVVVTVKGSAIDRDLNRRMRKAMRAKQHEKNS